MDRIRCLLVDDEPPALEVLKAHIAATPLLEVAGECQHAMGAFEFLQSHNVDLLFLDIQMPLLKGTELLKSLANPPKVIFTTAHREFAVDGFDFNAVDFLLKPISLDRFLKAVQKVMQQNMHSTQDAKQVESKRFVYFRAERKMIKLPLEEITYVESLKDYVKIHGQVTPLVTKQTITAIQEMLPPAEFLRVHRSFIVAIDKVTSYSSHSVFVGREEIPIGPLYRNEVHKCLEIKR
jgi:DNA-binding LytR/AlgR family response regulator